MPEPGTTSPDTELRALVERVLSASYELDREIGRGGMGIVYRAKDKRLKRTVAVKLLPPELAFRGEIRTRFLREAETAAQLNHPNIVPIYSVDEREGLVYFVMTCVDGVTLAKKLHTQGTLSIEEARKILREVADALAYAHGRGVIHRDIKPDNILLDADSGRAMVTDFGIARAVQEGGDSRLTATGMAIGTPAYMSPEQAVGDKVIDGRSDLYSLGVVAYQALVGEPPFVASSTPAMLMKHLTERPVPIEQRRPDVPRDLAAIVMTLLEKEPERRFPSAGALVMTLDGIAPPPARPSAATGAVDVGAARISGSGPVYTGAAATSAPPPLPSGMPAPAWGTPAPAYAGGYGGAVGEPFQPTSDDLSRWSAPPVEKFRRRFATYAAVNAIIVLASIFGDSDFFGITVIWSMFMAASYAKLWTAGYDWRDVFKQPRDRRLVDVASETVDEMRTMFDRNRSPAERARVASRRAAPALPSGIPGLSPSEVQALGARAPAVQRAAADLAEIQRLVEGRSKSDRQIVNDVVPSARALFDRVRALAFSLADLDRSDSSSAHARVEAEIATLEAQANPLERESEDRVRRLALLKRERRGLADGQRRKADAEGKLESCLLALGSMKLDLIRYSAGNIASAANNITMLTERARALADEVDAAVYAADEVGRVTSGRDSGGARVRNT